VQQCSADNHRLRIAGLESGYGFPLDVRHAGTGEKTSNEWLNRSMALCQRRIRRILYSTYSSR